MPSQRLAGPVCQSRQPGWGVDEGTSCLQQSPSPILRSYLRNRLMECLSGSVGLTGENRPDDVETVKAWLNEILDQNEQLDVHGSCDPQTLEAIRRFQRTFMIHPDGCIDPGGRTEDQLRQRAAQSHDPLKIETWTFPFTRLPKWKWTEEPRSFGSARDRGRKHAGCDLYFPLGTWIYAVADGKVVTPPYKFPYQTQAVEIQHGRHVVRYAEIMPGSCLVKSDVRQGTRIAKVGKLVGIRVESPMLHFELYAGTATGGLTDYNNPPYFRRKDLLDPTKHLQQWSKRLPLGDDP